MQVLAEIRSGRQIRGGWAAIEFVAGRQKLVIGRSGEDSGTLIHDIATNTATEFTTTGKESGLVGKGRTVNRLHERIRGRAGGTIWVTEVHDGKPFRVATGCMPSWLADGKTLFFQAFDRNQLMSTEVTGDNQFSPPRVRSHVLSISGRFSGREAVAYKSGSDLVVRQIDDGKVAEAIHLPKETAYSGLVARRSKFGFGGWNARDPMPYIMLDVETGLAHFRRPDPFTMPAWSPDGTKITFDLRLSRTEIRIIDSAAIQRLPTFQMEDHGTTTAR